MMDRSGDGPDNTRRSLARRRPWLRVAVRVVLPALVVVAAAEGMFVGLSRAQAVAGDSSATGQGDEARGLPERLTASDFARMLPPTDLAAERPAHGRMPGSEAFPVRPFLSTPVASNPLAGDASPIGARSCAGCHRLEDMHVSHGLHVRAFNAGAGGVGPEAACEACHGPGSEHAKRPRAPGLIIAYTHDSGTPVQDQVGTCLGCHAGGARQHWQGSVHDRRGLSCTDCHNPMVRLSAEGLLAKASVNEVCATCHRDIRAQFNRRSHMPLPEGQLSCVDCHNPHGTFTEPLLKTDTVNGTCYACHAEKRGPFLFEHPPVRDNCLTCHTPHGSNHADLLVLPPPMLCQQCHANHQHPNDLLTRQNLRSGLVPGERVMGRACLNCHSNIHGSNHPSGPTLVK